MEMNMGNIGNRLMNRFFRRVDGVVWDLMSGRLGVTCADGIATLEGAGDDAQVTINMFDQFGLSVPAFAQNTPTAAVNVGDLVVGQRGIQGWVVEVKEKSLSLMKPDGTRTSMTPPKVSMMGLEGGVMVLRSLVNMLPGGTGGLNQMQTMLMPMLMMGQLGGDGESGLDLDSIMPMMLMGQMNMGAPVDPSNPNAALLQQNSMGQMMQMMMMAQLFKGGAAGGLFGGGSKKTKSLTDNSPNNFFDKRS
jgi:hypothetical protein